MRTLCAFKPWPLTGFMMKGTAHPVEIPLGDRALVDLPPREAYLEVFGGHLPLVLNLPDPDGLEAPLYSVKIWVRVHNLWERGFISMRRLAQKKASK